MTDENTNKVHPIRRGGEQIGTITYAPGNAPWHVVVGDFHRAFSFLSHAKAFARKHFACD
jgi:hypothetical protein